MPKTRKMKTKFYEGEMKIYDKDGNGTIDANDKMILGHCAPTWTGSFTSNLSYKNIDFSFSIYTSQGGMVYSPFMAEFVDYGQRGMNRLNMDYYIPQGAPILGADGSIAYQEATHYGSYPFPPMVETVKEAVHTGKVVPMRTGHKISLITHMSESKTLLLAILFHRNGFQNFIFPT